MREGSPIGHLWPAVLREGPVRLRPLRRRDRSAWQALRARNQAWLTQWEATTPDEVAVYASFRQMVAHQNRLARDGGALPFAIDLDGRLVGQVQLSCVLWGSLRTGAVGYWIDQAVAGRGIMPTAVAMLTDHAILECGLNRVEVNIRPENTASLRVVQKLGFRDEGVRVRYLHIDGDWRDHRTFAVTKQDLAPDGLLQKWRDTRTAAATPPPP